VLTKALCSCSRLRGSMERVVCAFEGPSYRPLIRGLALKGVIGFGQKYLG
jgi:hypothetical protein